MNIQLIHERPKLPTHDTVFTIGVVNSDNLTRPQLAKLAEKIRRQRDYLTRLRDRMNALSFPASDPLYAAVARALDAISNLTVIAASKANRPREGTQQPTIMERMPWGGEDGGHRPKRPVTKPQ